MEKEIILVSFDINGLISEDLSQSMENIYSKNTKESLENPSRIFEEFFSIHKMSDVKNEGNNQSELLYEFSLYFEESSKFKLIIINDLSYIHERSLDADGLIIFINLEDPKTGERLESLIRYIIDSMCMLSVKTYIIGLYKDKILPTYGKDEMNKIISEQNLNYEYYQINYNCDDKNNSEHICLLEYIKTKNNNNKQNKIELNDEEHNYKLHEIIENIILNIYGDKMSVEYLPDKKKFVKKKVYDKNQSDSQSNSSCIIF